MSNKWDTIVVGGGIWGMSCAYACAKRGQKVAVVEAGSIGQGASGGVVGAMAPHVPESWNDKKQFQFDALSSAENFWREVDDLSGLTSGYGRIGRLMPITSERDLNLHKERINNAKNLWQGKYHWNVLDKHDLIPLDAAPYGVVHDTLSARIFPLNAVKSLATACGKLRVEFFENHKVEYVTDNTIEGPWGKKYAPAIIIAAGTDGFGLLDPHLGCITGVGVKGQAALMACDLGSSPQIYANGVYIIPHSNGVTAIGSTSEKNWADPYTTDHLLDGLITKAAKIYPALQSTEVLQRWAGLRPKARRRHPMLGPVPGLQGVYTAMGAFTIGFGIAHSIGEILADFASGNTFDLPRNFTIEWHME